MSVFMGMWKNVVLAARGFAFQSRLVDDFYRHHLGHAKTIGLDRGLPVYSLFFPALTGREQRHAVLHMVLGRMRNVAVPSLATVAVTDRCECRCGYCCLSAFHPAGGQVLSRDELLAALRQCEALGCCTVALVGGEPLLRDDVLDVLHALGDCRSQLLLFTNGYALAEKAGALRAAGVRRVFVSLDSAEAARHDAARGVSGLHARAVQGLRRARGAGLLTGVSMTLTDASTPADLEAMKALCRRERVCELYINVAQTCGRRVFASSAEDAFLPLVQRMNADRHCPFGVFYYPHFAGPDAFGCAAGFSRLYITPYGDVTPCDVHPEVTGNLRNEPLREIWLRMSRRPEYACVSPCGCRAETRVPQSHPPRPPEVVV